MVLLPKVPPNPAAVSRLAGAVAFTDYACVSAMRTVLPYYAAKLPGALSGGAGVGALESVYGLGQAAGAVVLGRASDVWGRRAVLLLCFAASAVGYALVGGAAVLGSGALLYLSRLPVGLAKQCTTVTKAAVSDVTPPARRSEALARLYAAGAFGYAVGPWLGGRLADRGQHLLLSGLCTASFVVLAPAVALLLPETRPAAAPAADANGAAGGDAAAAAAAPPPPPPPPAAGAAWRDPRVRRLLLATALPEVALLMQVGVSIPLLARSVGWSATQMGVFASAAGLSAGLVGLGPLPWALRSPRVSDAGALLAGNACLIALSLALAARATALRLWLCLPLHIGAVALLRTLSASVVSKAAPAEMRGEALGALDAVSSLCRIGVPTLAGYLVDRLGIAAPFLAQAFLCTAGATTLWRVVSEDGRAAPPDRDR